MTNQLISHKNAMKWHICRKKGHGKLSTTIQVLCPSQAPFFLPVRDDKLIKRSWNVFSTLICKDRSDPLTGFTPLNENGTSDITKRQNLRDLGAVQKCQCFPLMRYHLITFLPPAHLLLWDKKPLPLFVRQGLTSGNCWYVWTAPKSSWK